MNTSENLATNGKKISERSRHWEILHDGNNFSIGGVFAGKIKLGEMRKEIIKGGWGEDWILGKKDNF